MKKKSITILGYSIWRIFAYFIIYSFLGYVLETVYSAIFHGVWESRQSFLYGPFCSIYGVGAVIMILFLQYFKKNNYTLFLGGFIVGSVTEYLTSLIGEYILNIKWWDYSNYSFNINGRICLLFSIFWGLIGLYLIKGINPHVDRFIDLIKQHFSTNTLKTTVFIAIIILFIDCVISGMAINFYFTRMVKNFDLDVKNKELILKKYDEIYSDKELSDIIYKYWNDEKMVEIYPNLELELADGTRVKLRQYLPHIQPYYYKFK